MSDAEYSPEQNETDAILTPDGDNNDNNEPTRTEAAQEGNISSNTNPPPTTEAQTYNDILTEDNTQENSEISKDTSVIEEQILQVEEQVPENDEKITKNTEILEGENKNQENEVGLEFELGESWEELNNSPLTSIEPKEKQVLGASWEVLGKSAQPFEALPELIMNTSGLEIEIECGNLSSSENEDQFILEIDVNQIKKAIKYRDIEYLEKIKTTADQFVAKDHEINQILTENLLAEKSLLEESLSDSMNAEEEFYLSPIQLALKFDSLKWLDYIIERIRAKESEENLKNIQSSVLGIPLSLVLFCIEDDDSHLEAIEKLQKIWEIDFAEKDEVGQTILHHLIFKKRECIFGVLKNNFSQRLWEEEDANRVNCFEYCALSQFTVGIEYYLAHFKNEISYENYLKLLQATVHSNSLENLTLVVEKNPNPNEYLLSKKSQNNQLNALLWAIKIKCHVDIIVFLLAHPHYRDEWMKLDENNRNLIFAAIEYSNPVVVEMLISKYSLPYDIVDRFGLSPGHYAISKNSFRMLLSLYRFKIPQLLFQCLPTPTSEPQITVIEYCLEVGRRDLIHKILDYALQNQTSQKKKSTTQKTQPFNFPRALSRNLNFMQFLAIFIHEEEILVKIKRLITDKFTLIALLNEKNANYHERTSFHFSAITNNHIFIKLFHEYDALNSDSLENSPIHYAAQLNHLNSLLEYPPKMREEAVYKSKQLNPVHLSCASHNPTNDVLDFIFTNPDGRTLFEISEEKLQMEKSAKISSPIFVLIEKNHLKYLQLVPVKSLAALYCNSLSVLHFTVSFPDRADVFKYFLGLANAQEKKSKGIDFSKKSSKNQRTFFHFICKYQKNIEYLHEFLHFAEQPANQVVGESIINAKDSKDKTAMHLCCLHRKTGERSEKNLEFVKVLLKSKMVNLDICDSQNRTALDIAVSSEDLPVVECILEFYFVLQISLDKYKEIIKKAFNFIPKHSQCSEQIFYLSKKYSPLTFEYPAEILQLSQDVAANSALLQLKATEIREKFAEFEKKRVEIEKKQKELKEIQKKQKERLKIVKEKEKNLHQAVNNVDKQFEEIRKEKIELQEQETKLVGAPPAPKKKKRN